MLPKILKNFAIFVDGRGYAGRCDEVTPPKMSLKTDDHRAGGMDAPVEMDMGMEKLAFGFSLSEYDPEVIKLFGLTTSGVKALTLRGAIEGDAGVTPVVINVRGAIKEIDMGNWKPGDKAPMKLAVSPRYYKLSINGKELIEIDVENMIRKINGVDQLAVQRKAIGI